MKHLGVLVITALIYSTFAAILIYGVIRRRHQYMLPMIIMTICLTIASIGTVVAITISMFENIQEEVQEHKTEKQSSVMRIVMFR